METLGKTANIPVDFDCNGENLKLYGLRLMDWGEIEQWMRSCIIDAAIRAIEGRPSMAPDLKSEIIQAAHSEGTRVSVGQCFLSKAQAEADLSKTMAFMRTFEGMLRVVQLSVRDKPGEDGTTLFKLKHVSEMFGNNNDLLIDAFGVIVENSFPTVEKTGEVKDDSKNSPQPDSETKKEE